MIRLTIPACLLAAAINGISPLHAQNAAPAPPPPRVLAWDDMVAARELALVTPQDVIDFTGRMHPHKRTQLQRVRGGPLAIRALDRDPAPDGTPVQRTVQVPQGVTHPLLVLLPDDEHATGIRILVVDDNPAGFRWGAYRFLNTTGRELVVQLDDRAVRVPGNWRPVDINLGGETRGVGARIALADAIERPLYSAIWEFNTDSRILCFLMPGDDPALSPVMIKAIPEDRLILEAEAAAERGQ